MNRNDQNWFKMETPYRQLNMPISVAALELSTSNLQPLWDIYSEMYMGYIFGNVYFFISF